MSIIMAHGTTPLILQLMFWFQTKFQKGSIATVQVGSRAPLIRNDYVPLAKIYFYEIVTKDNIPVFVIAYNSLKLPVDISLFQEGIASKIGNQEVTLHFVYTLIDFPKLLLHKYEKIKEEQDKLARGQGLSNLIRAESQFLSLFERNEEIEDIKAAEKQQSKLQKQISDEIIKLQKSKFDFKIIIALVIFFYIFGYLFQSIQEISIGRQQRDEYQNIEKSDNRKPKVSRKQQKSNRMPKKSGKNK